MWAQALIEKGALDSLVAGVGLLIDRAATVVGDRRGLWVIAALAVLLLFRRRKRF